MLPDYGRRPKHVGAIIIVYFNVNFKTFASLINSAFVDV
jgi:hypothetical protein